MALPAQVPAQTSVAVGGQTVFPFNFKCLDAATIKVYLNGILQGGVAIFLNADQVAAPGGTVTLGAGATAGDLVLIQRTTALSQTADFPAYGNFGGAAVTAALDRMEMQIQELAISAGVGGALQPNEVPVGLINSTDGTDGNGLYTLSRVPLLNRFMFIKVDGVQQPGGDGSPLSRWSRVAGSNQFTFNPGFHPTIGSDLHVDYYA